MRLYLSRIEGPPPKRNAPGSNPGKRATSEQAMYACSDFFVKIGAHSRRCSSSFAKSHARLACSLVNALTTAPGRYQLFASCPPATSIQSGQTCHQEKAWSHFALRAFSYTQNNCPHPGQFQSVHTCQKCTCCLQRVHLLFKEKAAENEGGPPAPHDFDFNLWFIFCGHNLTMVLLFPKDRFAIIRTRTQRGSAYEH